MTADPRPVLITGGAGFIGSNLANRLLQDGQRVELFDNLSRRGSRDNLEWLRRRHPGAELVVTLADIRDRAAVRQAVQRTCRIYHFAAQVAVTTSLVDPDEDFAINAAGTLYLLEAIRQAGCRTPLLYTSTNKVYGALEDLSLTDTHDRYEPGSAELRRYGLGEDRPLDFRSPYGCSKGCADQYVLDFSRLYGIPAVVFRMSCIYGPRQRGNEDQGWVAHFLLQALRNQPITIFGDGRQVRDLLYVDDLLEAMVRAQERMGELSGRVFNVGGGVDNALSLRALLALLGELRAEPIAIRWAPWRPADQRYYVADIRAVRQALGWTPTTSVAEGVSRLLVELESELQPPGKDAAPSEPTLTLQGALCP